MMTYFVLSSDNQAYGPIDLEGLKAWVREGRVVPDTFIREGENGRIVRASEISELWDGVNYARQAGIHCPVCGAFNDPRQKVCAQCGTQLSGRGPGQVMAGSETADKIIGFLVGLFSICLYGVGGLGALVLYFVVKNSYPAFAKGIGSGLLTVLVVGLGLFAVCMASFRFNMG
jgi:hypothetical protein